MQILVLLIDFSLYVPFFYLPFQFVILNSLISVCTQFHRLFFGRPLSQLPYGLLLKTWHNFLLLSIVVTS